MILITWENSRREILFVIDARSVLFQGAKKPDISHGGENTMFTHHVAL